MRPAESLSIYLAIWCYVGYRVPRQTAVRRDDRMVEAEGKSRCYGAEIGLLYRGRPMSV